MGYQPNVVMITGATGDFGRAFAERFAALGCRIVLVGRNADKLQALCDGFEARKVFALCFDITDRLAMQAAVDGLPEEFREIDLLINNAGGALGMGPVESALPEDLQAMVDSNVSGLVAMTRAVLPGMVARKRGHVINIGSTAGHYPYPGGHVYCAAKAFVMQFSLALRADLVDKNVRVTCLAPGMVETQFSLVRFKGDEAKAKAVYANANPLTAQDIAEAAAWVATQPSHVNVNMMEIMPTTQAPGPLQVYRGT